MIVGFVVASNWSAMISSALQQRNKQLLVYRVNALRCIICACCILRSAQVCFQRCAFPVMLCGCASTGEHTGIAVLLCGCVSVCWCVVVLPCHALAPSLHPLPLARPSFTNCAVVLLCHCVVVSRPDALHLPPLAHSLARPSCANAVARPSRR